MREGSCISFRATARGGLALHDQEKCTTHEGQGEDGEPG